MTIAERERADRTPRDVAAQVAAAYACDREGHEADAVVYYDRAWRLGGPADGRAGFLIGYGSTLKNVGRLAESEAVLRQAIAEGANADAARAFLALTLYQAGRSHEAVAGLLELLIEAPAAGSGLERFRRALQEYAALLREGRAETPSA
jgi:tetratricopeptide (TPR) repeat protein